MSNAARPLVVLSVEELEELVRAAVRVELAAVSKNDVPEVLDRKGAAELLRVDEAVVVRYVKREGLPAYKMGPLWRFKRSELLRWLGERKR